MASLPRLSVGPAAALLGNNLVVRPSGRALASGAAAVLLAHLVALLAAPAPAEARPRSYSRERAEPAAAPQRQPEGPLQVVISIGSQRLWVYDKNGLVESSTISTGVGGYPTPMGVFAVIDKEQTHYSNIYGGASMPFMQRLTMSGVAMHSGMVTGRPASHGCVRLPHAFAIKLYKLTKLGVRVVIAPNEPAPQEIAHARLFVRKQAQAAEPIDPSRAKGIVIASATDMTTAVANARVGKITAERAVELQKLPISVLVSKADGKVIVRHGFRQVFEAPIVVRDPDRALGTHVYTALEFKDGGDTMRWQVVSVPTSGQSAASPRRVSRASRSEAEPPFPIANGPPSTAAEALDRIDLPKEAVDRIAEMLTPGTSLIISDHGHNREMRAVGTDFIVLTR
jgi:lipoprotein-anchoring transpeptidase ErfK/SrfK